MASLSKLKGGDFIVQATVYGVGRKTVRLGKLSEFRTDTAKRYHADEIRRQIGWLERAHRTGESVPGDVMQWLRAVPDDLHEAIARTGLCEPRAGAVAVTLGDWLKRYVAERQDVKPATSTVYGHTQRNLVAFFGQDKPLDSITQGDVDAFAVYLKTAAVEITDKDGVVVETEGLSDNTVRRRLGIAKQFFRAAVRRRLIRQNPVEGHSTQVRGNRKRDHYVARDQADQVLAALPYGPWRLAFALARYGGLRCPSEIQRLTWSDVSWDSGRFTVHASKTEHHDDGGIRVVPMFPELLPYFREAFEAAEDGEEHCCPQYPRNIAAQMYRKVVLEAMKRAGVTPWPKLFQNCRATRETELLNEGHNPKAISNWIGHSITIALEHYVQVTDQDFERATSAARALQPHENTPYHDTSTGERNAENEAAMADSDHGGGWSGGRYRTLTDQNDDQHNQLSRQELAESCSAADTRRAADRAAFDALADSWDDLPEAIRAAILAMVDAVKRERV